MTPSATPTAGLANSVILAENDGLMRSVIRSVLVRAEQQVFPVADGLEAIGLARQFRARLVMLDVAMPRLNGLQTCEAIRALPGYADVPIVMLTGYDDAPTRQAAQRLGANDFITKPFRPYQLLARLSTYLDLPSHLVPAGGTDEILPSARVWNSRQDPGSAPKESPQPAEGHTTVLMYRKADRKD